MQETNKMRDRLINEFAENYMDERRRENAGNEQNA